MVLVRVTVSVDSSKKTRISAVRIEPPTLADSAGKPDCIDQSDRSNNNRIVFLTRDQPIRSLEIPLTANQIADRPAAGPNSGNLSPPNFKFQIVACRYYFWKYDSPHQQATCNPNKRSPTS